MKEIRKRAEEAVRKKSLNHEKQSLDDILKVTHELEVHQIELEMQNEELRRIQMELEISRDRYIDLYDFAPIGYLTVNAQGKIQEANLTAVEILGIERINLINQPITRFIFKDDQDDYYLHRKKVFDTRTRQVCEIRMVKKDDSKLFHVRLESKITNDNDGVPSLRVIFSDITKRKTAEKIAIDSQKLAGLGSLAAGMAHEINSPLQIITGLSSRLIRMIKNGKMDEVKMLTQLETIKDNGWRIANIVQSLLTYARPSFIKIEAHQLNEIIENTLLLIENQLRSWSNITIKKIFDQDMPPILTNSSSISQIIINLLSNAADAMPYGGWITIQTSYDRVNKQFTLQITDTGVGIPEENQVKIFNPFFTTKEVGKGTGLGLSIVQGIVNAHNGEITVESTTERGTTFTITLPEEHTQIEHPVTHNTLPNRYEVT